MTKTFLQFGCGNMGGAMLKGWLAGGLAPETFTVVDPYLEAAPHGVRLLEAAPAGEDAFDIVLLGFKPQQLPDAAQAVRPFVGPRTLLLSILAGVDLATLRRTFPEARAIVRVMPNLAAALGKSPIALFGDADEAARAETDALMAPLGQAEWLSGEDQMDLVTALAGSGPAFVYRFIDALAEGAAALGLPRDQADRLALSMVEGSAMLAAASEHSPGELARRVASPGGVTQVGIDILDAERRLARLVEDTLRGARDRSAEMTEQARARQQ
ncbi:pyrroline-5-carboxylate reductase [Novosphingobium aromaticivorans DSM 12444]|uniref:Pyrroline-5-carboxylate reductase n=1 Tax=Novosphingobium aromaticivorans (strain ATCC 700278 / DSM 12444 / CCUG 56034 / CIP 105152 / NBRC 16084 / F199) TaxID=279238 RepID=Q2G986_NOVAD|nr:pyrroline-5-carboxylate reductase [Novosphingobium aromaticivorans]ABD25587.1 pyrroline-5-carboxylate reductase [Novosphingobium aromaticivorans DSM 12444]SCX97884.1 pyrroline-5-carboxylate reductase [Novosphingobium aromaticivorans]